MLTEKVVVANRAWLGECVKLADPLSRHIERHQAALGTFKNLSCLLPQR